MSEWKRSRTAVALGFAIFAFVAFTLAACGGDDETTASPTAPAASSPSEGTTPPASNGSALPAHAALPPEAIECFAEEGYEVAGFPDLASVPQQAVQACSGAIH
jgi:hypothetical protein